MFPNSRNPKRLAPCSELLKTKALKERGVRRVEWVWERCCSRGGDDRDSPGVGGRVGLLTGMELEGLEFVVWLSHVGQMWRDSSCKRSVSVRSLGRSNMQYGACSRG